MIRRFKDRLGIIIGVILVLLTILIIIDIQMDLGYTPLNTDYSSIHLNSNNFPVADLFAQKSNSSTNDMLYQSVKFIQITEKLNKFRDNYTDLIKLIDTTLAITNNTIKEKYKNILIFEPLINNPNKTILTLKDVAKMNITNESTILDHFHAQITNMEMYSKHNWKMVNDLLKEIALRPIVSVVQKEGGTQLKLIITHDNDMQSLFKPMRFARDHQTLPNHFYFSDYERHTAEIAAFHLDHVLEFRRSMPVTGRLLNITTEIFAVADYDLMHTAFTSPANNLCFHGKCSYYCDTGHAICGQPDTLEGSFAAFLPNKSFSDRKIWRHPWRRSYNKRKKANWETDDDYCSSVRRISPLNDGRRLLDLIDMSIYDFLMGNMDRHHYETFRAFGDDIFTIHLDHGRGFGKAYHDELSILSPLIQCCIIRVKTLQTLLNFHNGPIKLSKALKEAMANDPIAPILWEPHLNALDRRVDIILKNVRKCIRKII